MRTNTLILWMALSMTGLHASAQQKTHTFSITPKAGITVNSFSGDMPVTIFFAKMGNTSGSDTEIHSYDPNDAILSEKSSPMIRRALDSRSAQRDSISSTTS